MNQARVEFEKLHAAHPSDLNTAILLGYTYNKLGAYPGNGGASGSHGARRMKTTFNSNTFMPMR